MPGPKLELPVNAEEVDQDNQQFHHPAGEGGDGGALDPQFRRAEVAENQDVVEAHVDAQGAQAHDGAHKGGFHTLERIHQGVGDGIDQIGVAHDFKIPDRLFHHSGFPGEQAQNGSRSQ